MYMHIIALYINFSKMSMCILYMYRDFYIALFNLPNFIRVVLNLTISLGWMADILIIIDVANVRNMNKER